MTNDDGYKAAGARALALAVRELGWSGVMIAPSMPMSGASRSRSATECIWQETDSIEGFDTVFVEATPAACVVFGMTSGALGTFDICLSGVNAGENLGFGLTISGTFGAALEAAAYGVRGIAVSRQYERMGRDPEDWDWSWVSSAAARAIRDTLELPSPGWRVANINLPNLTEGSPIRPAKVSEASYFDDRFDVERGRILSQIGYDPTSLRSDDDIMLFAERRQPTVTLHTGRIG